MSTAIDSALTDRIAQLIREIEQVEAARVPIEQEVQAELTRLEAIAARGEASPSLWLSDHPGFSAAAFEASYLAGLMMLEPDRTRAMIAARAKRRAEAFKGLRLAESEKQRRLAKLHADLRQARARLELRRREIELATNDVLPRAGDDPSIWLMLDQSLGELAGAGNGRSR